MTKQVFMWDEQPRPLSQQDLIRRIFNVLHQAPGKAGVGYHYVSPSSFRQCDLDDNFGILGEGLTMAER